ncbi:hypothetical protein [Lentzea pudingi]|uniref:hypothetical protein n=1 Tax=Lentzea pudingi TaxID=1789439 RepID=UPI0016662560|nr:hypothetical protein [Lentzea pudingi]
MTASRPLAWVRQSSRFGLPPAQRRPIRFSASRSAAHTQVRPPACELLVVVAGVRATSQNSVRTPPLVSSGLTMAASAKRIAVSRYQVSPVARHTSANPPTASPCL